MSKAFFNRNHSAAKLFSFGSQCLLRLLLSAVAAVVLVSTADAATTYYVAKTGSNNYSCTQGQSPSTPKLTIAAGLACMASGDTLIISAGTYAEYITYNQLVSGTGESARTLIKAASGETVVLKPTTGTPTTGTGHAIWVYGKQYITFDGLIIDARNISNTGFFVNNNGKYIRLQNSEVMNAPGNCVAAQVGFNIEIIDAKIHDCGLTTMEHGVYFRGSDNLIERSSIYNISGFGVHLFANEPGTVNNTVIRHNHIYANGSSGIILGSGSNNIAHHNIIRHNAKAGIRVSYAGADNNKVYNNTIFANGGECVRVYNATNTSVKNNLCLSNTINTISNTESTTVIAKNRLSMDLTLVTDATNNNFMPRGGSPLVDAGESISGFSAGKFLGSAPDQGASEATPNAYGTIPAAPKLLTITP